MQSSSSSNWQDEQDPQILALLAAQAALDCNWQDAIKINEKILKDQQADVEALNRLARAQVCTGRMEKAQKTYKKVLEIDPYNIIANKNLNKINISTSNKANGQSKSFIPNHNLNSLLLSEPGKTKVISLLNLAPPNVLALLDYGEPLRINPKSHAITITTGEGVYLGALPDDIAHKLISFIGGGNKYEAYVKSVTPKSLTIFIRETERSQKFINQPSFQQNPISYFDTEE